MINTYANIGCWSRPERPRASAWRFSADLPQIMIHHLKANIPSPTKERDFSDFCAPPGTLESRQAGGVAAISAREQTSEIRPANLHPPDAGRTLEVEEPAVYRDIESLDNFGDLLGDFLRTNSFLIDLLSDAKEEIRKHFGSEVLTTLKVAQDPDVREDQRLFVLIQTHLNPEEALTRLDELYEDWWLDVLPMAQHKMSIDVEYV